MLNRDDKGYYFIEGKKYVSVTTFLKIIHNEGLTQWMVKKGAEAKEISKTAADLGSEFHTILSDFIEGKMNDIKLEKLEKNENLNKMFTNWSHWWTKNIEDKEMALPERTVWSDIFGYAGTLDCTLPTMILDWKTSSKIYDEYILQAHAYSFAEAEMRIRKAHPKASKELAKIELLDSIKNDFTPKPIWIVRIDKNAPFKVQTKPKSEPMSFDWKYFDLVLSALKLWRWQNEKED